MNTNGDLNVKNLNVKDLNARGIKGYYRLKSSDAELYIHSNGGSRYGNHQTLHTCSRGGGNCEWEFQRTN